MFSSILTLDFDLILGSFLTFWGPNGLFWDSKTIFGPNHVVEQLLSSSILTFFIWFWDNFLLFRALMGYFWGWGRVQKLFRVLFIQLNNFYFPSILTFDFHLILEQFFTFWAIFGVWGRAQKLFRGLLLQTIDFGFLSFALFLLYHVVFSVWVVVVVGGCSQQLVCLNPTTVMVVVVVGLQQLISS